MGKSPLPPFHRGVTSRKLKAGVFTLEGINSLATTYFFYDIYFYTRAHFNFGALRNLILAATIGAVYAASAYLGGRFAQKFGYFTSVQLGSGIMIAAFLVGSQVQALSAILAVIFIGNVGLCLTWPALEALMSEGEPPARLQSLVGIYNVVWSGMGAFAYFTGGILMQWGAKNIFYVPAALLFLEVALAFWLEKQANHQPVLSGVEQASRLSQPASGRMAPGETPTATRSTPVALNATERAELASWLEERARLQPLLSGAEQAPARVAPGETPAATGGTPVPPNAMERAVFLKMAWLANPLAYLAINTVIPTIPSLAGHFDFTPMQAGFVCSIWLFARTAAFVFLRLWPKWHYRFRFLAGSFMAMIVSFGALLMVRNIWVLILSQAIFGITIGLIYYSSLFYSMDVGETKGEHGGIHEAAIGAGNAMGPAMAAAALAFFPQYPGSGATAVCALLIVGLGGLYWMRFKSAQTISAGT